MKYIQQQLETQNWECLNTGMIVLLFVGVSKKLRSNTKLFKIKLMIKVDNGIVIITANTSTNVVQYI